MYFHCTRFVLLVCLLSYPYSEDSSQGKQYMNTRCPAWCDRILLSAPARDLVLKVSVVGCPFQLILVPLFHYPERLLLAFPWGVQEMFRDRQRVGSVSA